MSKLLRAERRAKEKLNPIMDVNKQQRAEALRDLIERRRGVSEAINLLRRFSWDSPQELVELTLRDVMDVMEAYLAGTMAGEDVELWAEALQGRDDVRLMKSKEELLNRVLFELSTPELFGSTAKTVPVWLERLRER